MWCRWLFIGGSHWKRIIPVILKKLFNIEWLRHFSDPCSCICQQGPYKDSALDDPCYHAHLFCTIRQDDLDVFVLQLGQPWLTRGEFVEPVGSLCASPTIDSCSPHQSPQVEAQRGVGLPGGLNDGINLCVAHGASRSLWVECPFAAPVCTSCFWPLTRFKQFVGNDRTLPAALKDYPIPIAAVIAALRMQFDFAWVFHTKSERSGFV